jgi:hypothetical protein
MPSEVAWHLFRTKLCHSPAIGEEKGRQISACKLDPAGAELPFLGEPEPATTERNTAIEVCHFNVGADNEQRVPHYG